MAKELQTYVRSEKWDDHTTISVKVKDMSIGCSEDYVFYTNRWLTKMTCVKCGDDEYLGLAKEAAWNHMLGLKQISVKKVPTNFFKDLFFKGE